MAFDFPAAPAVNDIYSSGGVDYVWDGVAWSFDQDTSTAPHVLRPGDTMTGVLKLVPPNPTAPEDAAHKKYVDETVATLSLWQGVWSVAANTPDLDPAVVNPLHGYTWTASTVDPQTPETAPAALPGIGGFSIASNDTVVWNGTALAYELIRTPNTASSIYIADTKPLAPFPGQLWWDSDSGKHYAYYSDADSSQWVQISGGGGGNPTGIADDAPNDGLMYGRQAPAAGGVVVWSEVSGGGAIPTDAPNDTQQYARASATVGGVVDWAVVTGGAGGITDAPVDTKLYGRRDAAWSEVTPASLGPVCATVGTAFPAAPLQGQIHFLTTDASLYIWYDDGTSAQWVEVSCAP